MSSARAEAGEHAHRPQLRAVHRGVRPAGVRVLAGELAVVGPVDRLDRHARHRLEVGVATASARRGLERRLASLSLARHGSSIGRRSYSARHRHDADRQVPDRNLALELVRVTEAAALAASRWMGRGDKKAPTAPRSTPCGSCSSSVPMDGIVVIGEGEKDEAPMLYNGERIGDGTPPETDIAVDPVDGTTLTALGRGNAISVIAVCERGTMFDPGPCVYMEKIAVGPECAGRHRHHRVRHREPPGGRQGQGRVGARRHRGDPRARPPRRPHRRGARGRRPHPAHPGRRRRSAPSRPRGPTPAPTSSSASAARPRA